MEFLLFRLVVTNVTTRMKDSKTKAKFPETITFTIDGNSYMAGEHVR